MLLDLELWQDVSIGLKQLFDYKKEAVFMLQDFHSIFFYLVLKYFSGFPKNNSSS